MTFPREMERVITRKDVFYCVKIRHSGSYIQLTVKIHEIFSLQYLGGNSSERKYLWNIQEVVFGVEPMSFVVSVFHFLNCSGKILSGFLQLLAVVVRDNFVYQSLLAGKKSHRELGSFLKFKWNQFQSIYFISFLPEQSKGDISLKWFHRHP